jgi:hypothetical protein
MDARSSKMHDAFMEAETFTQPRHYIFAQTKPTETRVLRSFPVPYTQTGSFSRTKVLL